MFATARHALTRGARAHAHSLPRPPPHSLHYSHPQLETPGSLSVRRSRVPRLTVLLAGSCTGLIALSHSQALYTEHEVVTYTRDGWPDLQARLRAGGESIIARARRANSREGEQPVLYIAAANAVIALLWRVAPPAVMNRHFTCCVRGLRSMRVWTLLTANFSHVRFLHLAANMLALAALAPPLIEETLGKQRFYELYVTAGVSAMSVSAAWKFVTGSPLPTIGASGCVCAVLAAWAVLVPHAELRVLDVQLTARELAIFYAAADVLLAVAARGRVDLAAHAGGAAAAIAYCDRVKEDVERERLERDRWMFFGKRDGGRPRTLWQEIWEKIRMRERD